MTNRLGNAVLAGGVALLLGPLNIAAADPVERIVGLDVHNPGGFLLAMNEWQTSKDSHRGTVSLWSATFDGSSPTSHVLAISYKDYADLQESDRIRIASPEWSAYLRKSDGMADITSLALGIQRIADGSGWHNHGAAMVYVMSVSDPATYAREFTTLVGSMESPGSIRLMEMRAGGEGTTHIVVVTAPDFVTLNEFTDELQASRAYADFARKVRGIREIKTTSIYRRIKTWEK